MSRSGYTDDDDGDIPLALIEQIVDGLLVNGSGQKADRLVLMQDAPKRDLGGWCRAALYDRIYYPLEAVLSTEPQASAWQPIETAPKNGAAVLAWGPLNLTHVIYWSRDEEPGWTDGEYTYEPTHWMPLPVPPVPAVTKETTQP